MVNDYVNEVINATKDAIAADNGAGDAGRIRARGPAMDEGQGRYTMGGYAGPSEQIPADTGGVNMRPPGALPLNPTPRVNVYQGVASSAPATRRQLPWYCLLLASAMVLFGYAIGGIPIALLFAVGFAMFGGLVFWVRNL